MILAVGVFVSYMLAPSPSGWAWVGHVLWRLSWVPLVILAFREKLTVMRRELAETQEELAYQAKKDGLTGVPNKLWTKEHLEEALARSDPSRPDVALLFIDVDDFKQINDTYGHLAGDEVLRRLAATLRRAIRAHDMVGRVGGDEFVVILERLASPAEAESIAQRCSDLISSDQRTPTFTASIGLAMGRPNMTTEDLMYMADTAMYAAKRSGDGQLHVHEPK